MFKPRNKSFLKNSTSMQKVSGSSKRFSLHISCKTQEPVGTVLVRGRAALRRPDSDDHNFFQRSSESSDLSAKHFLFYDTAMKRFQKRCFITNFTSWLNVSDHVIGACGSAYHNYGRISR